MLFSKISNLAKKTEEVVKFMSFKTKNKKISFAIDSLWKNNFDAIGMKIKELILVWEKFQLFVRKWIEHFASPEHCYFLNDKS